MGVSPIVETSRARDGRSFDGGGRSNLFLGPFRDRSVDVAWNGVGRVVVVARNGCGMRWNGGGGYDDRAEPEADGAMPPERRPRDLQPPRHPRERLGAVLADLAQRRVNVGEVLAGPD